MRLHHVDNENIKEKVLQRSTDDTTMMQHLKFYEDLIIQFKAKEAQEQQRSDRYTYLRLLFALLFVVVIYVMVKTHQPLFYAVLLMTIVLFIWAVIKQQHHEQLKNRFARLIQINQNEIDVLSHQSNHYDDGEKFVNRKHHFTNDLDIFGPHSLFGKINRGTTHHGLKILASWMNACPELKAVQKRQQAIQILEKNASFRQDLAADLWDISNHHADPSDHLNAFFSNTTIFPYNKWLEKYLIFLPLIWAVLVVMWYLIPATESVLIFIAVSHLLISLYSAKKVSSIQAQIGVLTNELNPYLEASKRIYEYDWSDTLIQELLMSDQTEGQYGRYALQSLKTIMDRLDWRLNFLVAIILNGLLLWDLRMLLALDQWNKKHPQTFTSFFEDIGQMEALSSLATYAYNHRPYAYPVYRDTAFKIQASGLKHPLIESDTCIPNDYHQVPPQKISLITGSNMAGKSTFLRTIGCNMILAYTGTRVHAVSFEVVLADMISYMRIQDDLEGHTSTFKAELDRLQMIFNHTSDRSILVLIDEMLRGTNSKDKLKGSKAVVKKIVDMDLHAIIATHDIQLADFAEAYPTIKNYYFDIQYDDGELVFDYKIKPGICTNFNASFLLKKMGLSLEEE